jgi:anthranilate/para-aminobenzoate synthase component I
MTPEDGPFILCEGGRCGAEARLFTCPVEIVRADTIDEVEDVLERVGGAAARGLHAAGFLTYEAGYALERRLKPLAEGRGTDRPIAWFGLFRNVALLYPHAVAAWLPDPAGAFACAPRPEMSREVYQAKVLEIAELIAAGEIYQANLAFPARVRVAGAPLALYAGLRARSQAGWGGVAYTGEHWLLSASPELFFTNQAGKLTARPMKGTAARGSDAKADAAAVAALAADPKNRAENLMIVDLTRNDLSRVSVPGSVVVPDLYTVETYPTVHHLTSTVEARLTPGLGAVDVLRAAFPCGSITGAPKIRAMEAIAALETGARGAYTGSMGWIAPMATQRSTSRSVR